MHQNFGIFQIVFDQFNRLLADFVDIIWQVSGVKVAPAAMQDSPLTCNLERFQDGVGGPFCFCINHAAKTDIDRRGTTFYEVS